MAHRYTSSPNLWWGLHINCKNVKHQTRTMNYWHPSTRAMAPQGTTGAVVYYPQYTHLHGNGSNNALQGSYTPVPTWFPCLLILRQVLLAHFQHLSQLCSTSPNHIVKVQPHCLITKLLFQAGLCPIISFSTDLPVCLTHCRYHCFHCRPLLPLSWTTQKSRGCCSLSLAQYLQ